MTLCFNVHYRSYYKRPQILFTIVFVAVLLMYIFISPPELIDKEQLNHLSQNANQTKHSLLKNIVTKIDLDSKHMQIIENNLIPNMTIFSNNSMLYKSYGKYIPHKNIKIVKDMNGENVVFSNNNKGIIFGNPLLINQCRHVFYEDIELISNWTEIISKQEKHLPWFWSRESISMMQELRKEKDIVWLTDRSKAQSSNYRKDNSTTYFNNPKTASTSMTHICNIMNGFKKNVNIRGIYVQAQWFLRIYHFCLFFRNTFICNNFSVTNIVMNVFLFVKSGFTVVRDPISRFMSGYYTVNRLIFMDESLVIPDYISFWKINGEPQRFRQFVDDLTANVSEFLRVGPLMHMTSQSAVLSVGQYDIHFVLRFEQLHKHYNMLAKYCHMRKLENEQFPVYMAKVGTKISIPKKMKEKYELMMGFTDNVSIDPAWFALDFTTYMKIVEYFKQDYICFKYAPNYQIDVIDKIQYLIKLKGQENL